MPEFLEERMPEEVRTGAQTRSAYQVQITRTAGGSEYRRLVHNLPMKSFVINFTSLRDDVIKRVLDLYDRAHGRYSGFRVRWPDDFTTRTDGRSAPTALDQTLSRISAGVYQLQKEYGQGGTPSGAGLPVRTIHKPVAGTAVVAVGGATWASGWTLASTTGRITFAANRTKAITGISKASQAVIDFGAAHSFTGSDTVHISGVAGMTEINGQRAAVTATSTNTITVAINSTGYSTYTSGGTANTQPQASETVTGGCEFDLPCRFNSDLDITLLTKTVRDIGSIEVVEILAP
jgi:uncharacterized protein (TIGR02217 family)